MDATLRFEFELTLDVAIKWLISSSLCIGLWVELRYELLTTFVCNRCETSAFTTSNGLR